MKQLKLILIILLVVGVVFAQEEAVNQTEELDIAKITRKAKADAKADFDISKRLTWGVGSALSGFLSLFATFSELEDHPVILVPMGLALVSGPFIASKIIDVDFPETRQMELANESERYRSVYQSKYISEIKKRRLTYSLASPVAGVVTGLGLYVWLFLLGGIAN